MARHHQRTPWVSDSEVEDSLLSLQIKSAGYLTKISARARAARRRHDTRCARWTPSRSSGTSAPST